MTKAIRLSPSGPVLSNEEGGTLVPGDGFELRIGRARSAADPTFFISTTEFEVQQVQGGITPTLRAELENTEGGRKYEVKLDLDTDFSLTWAEEDVSFTLQLSRDDGATWLTVGVSTNKIPANDAPGHMLLHWSAASSPVQGSAIPNYEEGDKITARALVLGGAGTVASTGRLLATSEVMRLELIEML